MRLPTFITNLDQLSILFFKAKIALQKESDTVGSRFDSGCVRIKAGKQAENVMMRYMEVSYDDQDKEMIKYKMNKDRSFVAHFAKDTIEFPFWTAKGEPDGVSLKVFLVRDFSKALLKVASFVTEYDIDTYLAGELREIDRHIESRARKVRKNAIPLSVGQSRTVCLNDLVKLCSLTPEELSWEHYGLDILKMLLQATYAQKLPTEILLQKLMSPVVSRLDVTFRDDVFNRRIHVRLGMLTSDTYPSITYQKLKNGPLQGYFVPPRSIVLGIEEGVGFTCFSSNGLMPGFKKFFDYTGKLYVNGAFPITSNPRATLSSILRQIKSKPWNNYFEVRKK